MGIVVKDYEITKGDISDVYIKLNAVRAGMGHNGSISCEVSIYRNSKIRELGGSAFLYNGHIHIPDKNIPSGKNVIEAVYPLLQEHLNGIKDDNNYNEALQAGIKIDK